MHHPGMSYELDRFVVAQDCIWEKVLAELRAARKECHWMWFVFPQIAGLGSTATSRFYAIGSLDEARAYLAHPTLGARLREAARLVLAAPAGTDAESIFGLTDARKLRSSMTLFLRAEPADRTSASVFREVLDRFYAGEEDGLTIGLLGR